MNIEVLKSDLAQAVTTVQKAVANKSVFPALEGILVKTTDNAVKLLGYSQEIGITAEIKATVKEKGKLVINAKLFSDMVKKLPNEIITISTDDKFNICITSGKASYNAVGINVTEYPELPEVDEIDNITLQGDLLREMISQTVFAVSDNIQKPTYTGSLYSFANKEFTIVAIDGYRMSVRKEPVNTDITTEFIVPKKTQQELVKLIENEVNIIVGKRYILFDLGKYKLISRLIEGSFLDYTQTLPKESKTKAIVNAEDITNAVDRMSVLCGDKVRSPIIATVNDDIEFSCQSSIGKASENVNADINGEQVQVGFNHRYMLEAIKSIESDKVIMQFNGELAPIVIKPLKGDNSINLVVPMRTNK